MTIPDIIFRDQGQPVGDSLSESELELPTVEPERTFKENPYPEPILSLSEDQMNGFKIWIDEYLEDLISQQTERIQSYADMEEAYRAQPEGKKKYPFEGACDDVMPVIAMAVDPIHARLDTGIFKQDPVFSIKALRKSVVDRVNSLEQFIQYYQRYQLKLREISSPRLMELTKLGTCAFKTVYDRETYKVSTYDESWKVIKKEVTRYAGPRVFGVGMTDLLFPAHYQHIQDCPLVAQRIRTTFGSLKMAEASNKLKNVDEIKGQEENQYNELDRERQIQAMHQDNRVDLDNLIVYEIWCKYDIDGDGIPESIVALYHKDTRTVMQLRYNWYFHQRYPFTVIPYSVTSDSILGIGIAEMTLPFQRALTKFHQMATDNAYLANIRMFIAKKDSGIEMSPRLYTGRTFYVDNPKEDFIPFQVGNTYPTTITERQNLFGMVEKRTGVSDYLTGRESPIIGSRATATSTIALIQEGTRRVEQVLENIRVGLSEVLENCLYIWIQYGTEGIEDIAFPNDVIAADVKAFFDEVDEDNVHGALGIELSAVDATNNRQAMQQMQLQIIQLMMGFWEKLLAAGAEAIQAQQAGIPQMSDMITDVMTAARKMFKELLNKYDIRNPDEYLPDLTRYLDGNEAAGGNGAGGLAGPGGSPAGPQGAAGVPGLPAIPGTGGAPAPTEPGVPGGAGPSLPGAGLPFGAPIG